MESDFDEEAYTKKCSGGFFFHRLPIYVIMTFEK